MFITEKDLVEASIPLLHDFFSLSRSSSIIAEPKGLFGIPDLLLYDNTIISIEYKLNNWRKALKQAYRYRSFSNESYVFLDIDYISNPIKFLDEFQKYNIGLCGVSNNLIKLYYRPDKINPYNDMLSAKALSLCQL
jgi:hypothetical protein